MESVDILTIIYAFDNLLLRDMLRKWQLYDESIYIGIFVQLFNLSQQLIFRHIRFVTNQRRFEATHLTRLNFSGYVSLAAAIVSYQNSSKMRTLTTTGYNLSHFSSNLLLNLL